MFRTPRRRTTRQRSGFNVSGEKSGNEAKLVRAKYFDILSPTFRITLQNSELPLPAQFGGSTGLAAVGGYLKGNRDLVVALELRVIDPLNQDVVTTQEKEFKINKECWTGFGLHSEIVAAAKYATVNLEASVRIESQDKRPIGRVQLFGIDLDTITAYSGRKIREQFDMKTGIYLPEIYYFKQDEAFILDPVNVTGKIKSQGSGEQQVVKACNRCARFLLVDVLHEHQPLGFSNHCVQRAPCQHSAFSRFVVENPIDVDPSLSRIIRKQGDSLVVSTNHGFQLECRPCKKFTVNAPLNPLRSTTQHREDGSRRRAFEQLVMHLLERDWIYFTYRQKYGEEFVPYIWEKFGRRCFGCGKELKTPIEMDVDHTLPLNYLWPLDDTATCLCKTCNSQKHDLFPFEFVRYREPGKLEKLAELTGLPKEMVITKEKQINIEAVKRLRVRIVWFFDEFLSQSDFQKYHDGKKAADLIVASLQRVFDESKIGWNLVDEYRRKTGKYPSTVTLGE